jgi:hypothetical protein
VPRLNAFPEQTLEFLRRDAQILHHTAQDVALFVHLGDASAKRVSSGSPLFSGHSIWYTPYAQGLTLDLAPVAEHGLDLCQHVEQLNIKEFGLSVGGRFRFHTDFSMLRCDGAERHADACGKRLPFYARGFLIFRESLLLA